MVGHGSIVPMCFHLTALGDVIPLLARTAKTDVMVNCARIGFKP